MSIIGKKPVCSCGCGYNGEKPDHRHCSLCLEPLEQASKTLIELRVNVPWYYHKRCYDFLAGLRTYEYITEATSQNDTADYHEITSDDEMADVSTPTGVLKLFDSDNKPDK